MFLGGVAALALLAMAYVRFTPVDASASPRPQARPIGEYPSEGGFYAVRAASDLDREALVRAILDTPRAAQLADESFITRTALWAFPDIVHVWEEDGAIHISSHLVYGRSDLGMNRKRVLGWLQEANR
ncbi:MAG: DUF1499 domain-containing protein [Pseudomonadota bacterium]